MATVFLSLCDQILIAASSLTSDDASKNQLSLLLNKMTKYVANVSHTDHDDEMVVYGYGWKLLGRDCTLDRCILLRLQLLLLSDVERVRAASIRALRYSIHRVTMFEKFLEYRLDYLVCRYVSSHSWTSSVVQWRCLLQIADYGPEKCSGTLGSIQVHSAPVSSLSSTSSSFACIYPQCDCLIESFNVSTSNTDYHCSDQIGSNG